MGITPKLTDAELVTLAVMQALLGFTSEPHWLRHARKHLAHLFRYLPGEFCSFEAWPLPHNRLRRNPSRHSLVRLALAGAKPATSPYGRVHISTSKVLGYDKMMSN